MIAALTSLSDLSPSGAAPRDASAARTDQAEAARRADLQTGLEALKQLAKASQNQGAIQKSAASDKIARLKAQLQSLIMFGGDPKTRARQAAQIAREIGEAAKAYASVGGGASAEVAQAEAQADAQSVQDGHTATPQSGDSPVAEPKAPNSKASDPQSPDPQAAVIEGQVAKDAAPPASDAAKTNPQSSPSSDVNSSAEDQAYIAQARLLLQQAKAVLKAAQQEVERKGHDLLVLGHEADAAENQVAQAAKDLGVDTAAPIATAYGSSAAATVSADCGAAAGASVSVSA